MQEQLITFQVAKLAKEKGFELNSCSYYQLHEEGQFRYTTHIEGEDSDQGSWVNEDIQNRIAITTQSLLQRWLREVHNIDVLITSVNGRKLTRYVSKIYVNKIWMKIVGHSVIYEDTFEKGLQEALKLIK